MILKNEREIKESTENGTVIKNKYDPLGFRYQKEVNGDTNRYIFDGWSIVAETNKEGELKSREVRGYSLVKKEKEETTYYYHQNEHGDVTHLTNVNGEVENSYSYDVFGNIREEKENVENVFKYAGEQLDSETQQYYLRARFYNPVVGRFTQEDIYRNDGLNLYVYVVNNPLLWIDPSGFAKCLQEVEPVPQRRNTSYTALTRKQRKTIERKIENRTATKQEYEHYQWNKRFANRRNRGVQRFWSEERKRLQAGQKGTRNWTEQQKQDIINKKTPTYEGKPIQGHHKYNAADFPQLADDDRNIYPVTVNEHLQRWHGGNWQNDTEGVPNNPNFEEEF